MAVREALVNAVYHRSYAPSAPDGTKVYLHADRIEVISYPGPAAGLGSDDFQGGQVRPIPARNRRVGELLKSLRLAEERSTGVPKIYRSMQENGSPAPEFDFDSERSYFRVVLPAHPEYVTLETLAEAAYLQTTGDHGAAERRLRDTLSKRPDSAGVAVALIRALGRRGAFDEARDVLRGFGSDPHGRARVAVTLADVLADLGGESGAAEAYEILAALDPGVLWAQDAADAAIVARRSRPPQQAHGFFKQAGDAVWADVKLLDEFAQTKIDLARAMGRDRRRRAPGQREARDRLLREARAMLERVLQLDAPRERHAWAWYNLSWVFNEQGEPLSRRVAAVEAAARLMPQNERFARRLEKLRARQR